MTDIIVFSKPACPQCEMTKRTLDKHGVAYQVVDISQDQEAYERVVAMGHRQAPVVVAGNDSWGGFRPDKIAQLAA